MTKSIICNSNLGRGARIAVIALAVAVCVLNALAQLSDQDQVRQEQMRLYAEVRREHPVPKDAKKLALLFSFPQEEELRKDAGLWGARYMTIDGTGDLFISDSRAHRILMFDSSGRFIRSIGKKGQAPGEFLFPRGIAHDGKGLIVNDTGNHRLQFFDSNGGFLSSFAVYKTYYEIAASEDGKIYAAPIRTEEADPLVDVFDRRGKIVLSFGTAKKFTKWQQLNWIRIASNARNVFVVYQSLPIFQVYSKSGALLVEANFGRGFMKDQEKMNISRDSAKAASQTAFISIVQDLKQYRGNAFVLVGHPRTEILEFDDKGRLIQAWWAERTYDSIVESFSFYSGFRKPRFYFLQLNPENLVRAFEEVRQELR
ncbi:MAG: NHL repeat-containing protein [Candidatus Aminicenantales bacterium]